jgi:spore photoproduct lyase
MKLFEPKRVFVEEGALQYALGDEIKERYEKRNIPVTVIESHNRIDWGEKELTKKELFDLAKSTLVVGVKKDLKFQHCYPSADYRLVTGTSCPARCEYCYLSATLGSAVYIRVYVNTDDIMKAIQKHIDKSDKPITTFEASSSSDPLAVEHITGYLQKLIPFFADQSNARLRAVTKFANVDPLLNLPHNGHTRFRFSLNADYVINTFEKATASMKERIEAAGKMQCADYPLGFILAPLIIYDGWKDGYTEMLELLRQTLHNPEDELTFELIMHRFTTKAKNIIEARYPETQLDFAMENRVHKGFGKYVYKEDVAKELEAFMRNTVQQYFPNAKIEYFT